MTLDDVRAMTEETITPAVAAAVLGCNANYIRVAARDCPHVLGFPVTRSGRRTHIPRRAFIRYMEGTAGPDAADGEEAETDAR